MNLLRFDPAGAISDAAAAATSFGVTSQQIAQFHEPLRSMSEPLTTSSRAEAMLIEYDRRREESKLGRVFRIANRLHDHLDAVAVIGDSDLLAAPAAWMQACCEPYHNELSRSGRGSKPRIYFADSGVDNDAVEGLLRRLYLGGYSSHRHGGVGYCETPTEAIQPSDRYAVVAVEAAAAGSAACPVSSQATAISLRLFTEQLAALLGDSASRWIPKLIVPVAKLTSPLRELGTELGCQEMFSLTPDESAELGIYSAAALLPAAFLGLDCIQLLVGAAAMNKHFHTAPAAENHVIRYVATQRALAHFCGRNERQTNVWHPSLRQTAAWHQRLMEKRNPHAARISTMLCTDSEWLHRLPRNVVVNHLLVQSVRTDPIPVPESMRENNAAVRHPPLTKSEKKRRKRLPEPALPDLMTTAMTRTDELLRQKGHPSTKLIMPEISMHTLGQLFEFWRLAAELERTC